MIRRRRARRVALKIDLTDDRRWSEDASGLAEMLANDLADTQDATIAEILLAIVEQIPNYRRYADDADVVQELAATLREVTAIMIDLIRDPAMPAGSHAVLYEMGRQVGEQRAIQGDSLDDVYFASHIALKVWRRHLQACARTFQMSRATIEFATQISDVLYDAAHEFAAGAISGFSRARKHESGSRAELVGQLLAGTLDVEDALVSGAAIISRPTLVPCTLLVLAPAAGYHGASIAAAMEALLDGTDGALRGPFRSEPVPHVAALVPDGPDVSWNRLLQRVREVSGPAHLAVFAERVAEPDALAPAYQWVVALLNAPPESRPEGLVETEAVLLPWVASQIPPGADTAFVRAVLGPVLGSAPQARQRLLDMARAFFRADGRIADAAEDMRVTQRTFHRYLSEFERLTGRSLRLPAQQMLVLHALQLHDQRLLDA